MSEHMSHNPPEHSMASYRELARSYRLDELTALLSEFDQVSDIMDSECKDMLVTSNERYRLQKVFSWMQGALVEHPMSVLLDAETGTTKPTASTSSRSRSFLETGRQYEETVRGLLQDFDERLNQDVTVIDLQAAINHPETRKKALARLGEIDTAIEAKELDRVCSLTRDSIVESLWETVKEAREIASDLSQPVGSEKNNLAQPFVNQWLANAREAIVDCQQTAKNAEEYIEM